MKPSLAAVFRAPAGMVAQQGHGGTCAIFSFHVAKSTMTTRRRFLKRTAPLHDILLLIKMRLCVAVAVVLLLSGQSAAFSVHRSSTRGARSTNTFQQKLQLFAAQNNDDTRNLPRKWQSNLVSSIFGALISTTTVLFPWQLELTPPTNDDTSSLYIHRQSALALTEEQQLVADVWKEVTRQYVDTTYNGLGEEGWKQKRLEAVKAVTNVGPDDDPEVVYKEIRHMLAALNDPYTRFLTPDQYEALAAYARGGSAGIGVSLVVDPTSGNVIVASVTKDGPAAKSGIEAGDSIVEVDGMDTRDVTAELVAAKCRGEAGSNVNIVIKHNGKEKALTLTRANIKVNPVEASIVTIDNKKIGLLRVAAFSQETVSQIVNALRTTLKGAAAIVIDLRGNAGGYMPAGVDVAKLFLEPQTRVISEVDKSGRATIYISDGVGSETKTPLYLLVDKQTASASEILTAALQDNHRAIVVGNTETFGKGRIQNVQSLENGSGIAVTKAKYVTPSGKDIHGVGIVPDKKPQTSCGPDDSAATCLSGII